MRVVYGPRLSHTMVVSKKCAEVYKFARELMNDYGLGDYNLTFNRSRQTLGRCYYPYRFGGGRIELSKYFVDGNSESLVLDILLHEIAHALTYKRYHVRGHGYHWQKTCIELGCNPSRCCNQAEPEKMKYKYSATCPKCYEKYYKQRSPKASYICRHCRLPISFKLTGE
jgi:predicted SprT family Zn-dependent metalloprotease